MYEMKKWIALDSFTLHNNFSFPNFLVKITQITIWATSGSCIQGVLGNVRKNGIPDTATKFTYVYGRLPKLIFAGADIFIFNRFKRLL